MKIKEHFYFPKKDLSKALKELAGKDFKIEASIKPETYHITTEIDYTEPEFNMLVLRTLFNNIDYLTPEEKNALEYAISCIKTLSDMGVIK